MIDHAASRDNFLNWTLTPQFTALAKERERRPFLMIIVGVLMIIGGAIWSESVAGWGIIFTFAGFVRRHRAKNREPDVLSKISTYEIIPCGIVIANSKALATPNSKAAAALVGGFSPEAPGYLEALAKVSEQVGGVYGSEPASVPPPLKEACALINDDTYHEGRRRYVPAQNSAGHDLYFFDSLLESSYFASQQIDSPLAFLAVPREPGPVFHVPFELIVWNEEPENQAGSYDPNIIQHDMPEDRGYVAPAESVALPLVERQIESHFGSAASVFHEIVSDLIHIDLHFIPPAEGRPWQTIVTSGMGDLAMSTPEDAPAFNRAELVLRLPAGWPLDQDSLGNEANYWPLRTLKFLARLPHQLNTWFGSGHTIPLGEGDLLPGFAGVILGPPHWAPESFASAAFPDGSLLHFLSVIPLYQSEMDFKLANGADALFEKLWNSGGWDLIQPGRPAVC
ncbi:suppressor of fused domain protein [Verrucomicrobiaceae bacterium 227]